MQSCFITFEGGEGAGKSTIIDRLYKDLASRFSSSVILTREPGGTKLGEEIRKLVLNHRYESKVSNEAELCLFLAARAQHIQEKIIPALRSDKIVLCDRFNDSSVVYQGYARGLGLEKALSYSKLVLNGLEPDLTIYLDIDPEIGLKRAKSLSAKPKYDRIESEHIEFHEKIREGFYLLSKKFSNRFAIIDASLSINEVYDKVYAKVEELLISFGW